MFYRNDAGSGAGVRVSDSDAYFSNTIFFENNATGNGGGILLEGGTGWAELVNCTMASNTTGGNGAGIYTDGVGSGLVLNSILWNGGDQVLMVVQVWFRFLIRV